MVKLRKISLLIFIGLVFLFQSSVTLAQEIELYDDFSDGIINRDLWAPNAGASEWGGKIHLVTEGILNAKLNHFQGMWFAAKGFQDIREGEHVNIHLASRAANGDLILVGIFRNIVPSETPDEPASDYNYAFCQRHTGGVVQHTRLQGANWESSYVFGIEYTANDIVQVSINGGVVCSYPIPGSSAGPTQNGFPFWFKADSVGGGEVSAELDWARAKLNQPPEADFLYEPEEPEVGDEVEFVSVSEDPEDGELEYQWDFDGDGEIDSTNETDSFVYDEAGEYLVSLTVTDEVGLSDTKEEVLEALPLTIWGVVYKNENEDNNWNINSDIPIGGATVIASEGEEKIEAIANPSGHYELELPKPLEMYLFDVKLKAPTICYHPDVKTWDYHNTVIFDGVYPEEYQKVEGNIERNLAVEYVDLNYSNINSAWELWHAGPVFSNQENVTLIHGYQLGWVLERGRADNVFENLDDLLQRKDWKYNTWQFEYANNSGLTKESITTYANRLSYALNRIRSLTSKNSSVVAHSMGGIIARKYIAGSSINRIEKLLTLGTPNAGLWLSLLSAHGNIFGAAPANELRPDSRLLWDLNTNSAATIPPIFASIGGYKHCSSIREILTCNSHAPGHDDTIVDVSSAAIRNRYFSGAYRNHVEINRIANASDQIFLIVASFLKTGTGGLGPSETPGQYGGYPFLTFALKNRTRSYYPTIMVENTQSFYSVYPSPLSYDPLLQTFVNWAGPVYTQSKKTASGAIIYTAQLKGEDSGKAKICYAKNKCQEIQIEKGQSKVIVESIDNQERGVKEPTKVALSVTPVSATSGGFAQAGSGGEYEKHSINVRPSALNENLAIYITEPLVGFGYDTAVEIGPEGTVLKKPATVMVEYKDSDIPEGHSEEEMRLLTWEKGRWTEVPESVVRPFHNLVTGEVNHLSLFAAGVAETTPDEVH